MKARSHRYRVSLLLMAVGVLLQALLLTGHLPHVHLHPAPAHPAGFSMYQTEVTERDQDASLVVRMRRPTFETGIIFPQWGQTAYSKGDTNWSIGLSDIQQQTAAQWVAIPINLYQSSVTSTQVMTAAITPTVQALVEGIHEARARSYHVFVVPLLSAGGTFTWSGSVHFTALGEVQAWFTSYWQALQLFAAAAAQAEPPDPEEQTAAYNAALSNVNLLALWEEFCTFCGRRGLLEASKIMLCRSSPSATQLLEWRGLACIRYLPHRPPTTQISSHETCEFTLSLLQSQWYTTR